MNEPTPADPRPQSQISLSLREHNIGYILPHGAKADGRLLLPCGALIHGDFIGDIFCESGSVIIKEGARFRGMVEADIIYVEGEVSSIAGVGNRSTLIGRQMVAASSVARINADIFSQSFALHKAKVWGTLRTLEEAEQRRQGNRAIDRLRVATTPAKA